MQPDLLVQRSLQPEPGKVTQDAVRKRRQAQIDKHPTATEALNVETTTATLELLRPVLSAHSFSMAVHDVVVEAVDRILEIETRRGEISRMARSNLDSEAQPYQSFIDQLFYRMAGLSESESRGLEARLANML